MSRWPVLRMLRRRLTPTGRYAIVASFVALAAAVTFRAAPARDAPDPWTLVAVALDGDGATWVEPGMVTAAWAFGTDDRVEVLDGTAPGARTATALVIDFGNDNQALCSGTLLSPNLVLTAAHCLHTEFDDIALSVTVYPGAPNGATPYGGLKASTFLVPAGWQADPNVPSAFDFAVVRIPGSGFTQVGPFYPLAVPGDAFLEWLPLVEVFGFASDKPPYTMWYATAAGVEYTPEFIGGHIDGYPGMSGAGLLARAADGTLAVIGILSAGPIADQPDDSNLQTIMTRVTPAMVGALRGFCEQRNCSFESTLLLSRYPVRGLVPQVATDR